MGREIYLICVNENEGLYQVRLVETHSVLVTGVGIGDIMGKLVRFLAKHDREDIIRHLNWKFSSLGSIPIKTLEKRKREYEERDIKLDRYIDTAYIKAKKLRVEDEDNIRELIDIYYPLPKIKGNKKKGSIDFRKLTNKLGSVDFE